MLTARTFDIMINGQRIDQVYYAGEEYTADTVRNDLIKRYGMDADIRVKLIKEIIK